MKGLRRFLGAVIAAGMVLVGGTAFAVSDDFSNYDFTQETFQTFTPDESGNLLAYLEAADAAVKNTPNVKVWITLRNPTSTPWNLSQTVVAALNKLMSDNPAQSLNSVSLRLEANPDYFPVHRSEAVIIPKRRSRQEILWPVCQSADCDGRCA